MLEIEIHPPPSVEERAAITQALLGAAEPDGGRGAWWRAGVAENVDPWDEPER